MDIESFTSPCRFFGLGPNSEPAQKIPDRTLHRYGWMDAHRIPRGTDSQISDLPLVGGGCMTH